jgi:hypothetical protein
MGLFNGPGAVTIPGESTGFLLTIRAAVDYGDVDSYGAFHLT